MKKLVFKENLKEKIEPIKQEIIEDALKGRFLKKEFRDRNSEIRTLHEDYLYSLFEKECRKNLNNFNLKHRPKSLWCLVTDKHDDNPNYPWHNHINTSTINGVLYLETIPKHGIKFKYDNKITYKEVKPYDLLIFPNFLDHVPIISKLKRRISLNFELNCVEKSEEIFGI